MNAFDIRNLHFSYRTADGTEVPVLRGLDLTIGLGEMVAIQGPSGSGKSTLLYVLGALLGSYQGEVRVLGQDLAQMSDFQRARLRNQSIGFVFQQFQLLPKATVEENILLPRQYPTELPPSDLPLDRVNELAKSLGIQDRLHHYPNQLSGGQQQRVSIARALYNNGPIILADEPTGSLDSQNSRQIIEILKDANRQGRTVIIITHDPEVAAHCRRVISIRDGRISEDKVSESGSANTQAAVAAPKALENPRPFSPWDPRPYLRTGLRLLPLAQASLRQNKSRSLLTMLGIIIGVAAVLSMITLGTFTKEKILDSYTELGVNTLLFYGYPNFQMRATDQVSVMFQSFDAEKDFAALKRNFPQIKAISPMLYSWSNKVGYGGKSIDSEVRAMGVSEEGLRLAQRKLRMGVPISPFHIANRSPVCVIGSEIFEKLFRGISPLGQMIYIAQQESSFACRVIGVMESTTSNKEWNKPNLNIYLPYTFMQGVVDPWNARIMQMMLELKPGSDIPRVGEGIKKFFSSRYGPSGEFHIGSDTQLISQMNRFLTLFTLMLAVIAMICLAVGGIGITNMMMVSVAERLKEIGVRKAFGATDFSVRIQYLVESVLICAIAGVIGLLFGFTAYQLAIYGATFLIGALSYEWVFNGGAILLSLGSILAVGLISGLIPAIKAERLQVIDALRSE